MKRTATAPHRRNLADVRRGGYDGLAARLEDPLWQPDYGPRARPPQGSRSRRHRPFLVAFNAYLDTDDVEVARAIAREVQGRDGGLPGVKALGLEVGGRAQVSMNLTDLQKTSMPVALEAVRQRRSNTRHRLSPRSSSGSRLWKPSCRRPGTTWGCGAR